MIQFDFLITADGELTGFSISGHSGFAEIGEDIICAAVSSAAYMAVNTVTEVLNVTPLTLRAEEDMLLKLERRDVKVCHDVLEGLKIHLLGLEEQYKDNIRVEYVEV